MLYNCDRAMKISVVIPAYNEELFLPHLLTSLQKQTCNVPFEIIVVDNNSTDKTVDLAKKYGAKVMHEKHQGYAYACNKGFFSATGDIIARADADYVVPKEWLSYIHEAFEKDKKLTAIGGPLYPLESAWWENLIYYPGIVMWMYVLKFLGRGFLFPNIAVRRKDFLAVNGFNTSLSFGEDTDMCLRLKKLGKVVFSPRMYVYTSLRRLRSLGLLRTVINYSIGNQIAMWQGKKVTVGLEPVRIKPKQTPTPANPWLYVFTLPGSLTLLLITLISLSLFAQMGKGQETSFKKVFSLQPVLTGILQRYEEHFPR